MKSLQDKYGLTHEEIAQRLVTNRSTITNTLRLLRLPPEIQEMISAGGLTAGHARALLSFEFMTDQLRAAAHMVTHGLSVRGAEELVAKWTKPPGDRKKKETPLDPNVRAAVLELERTLGTRVKIVAKGSSGRIEIRYYSETDLNRIYDWILRRPD